MALPARYRPTTPLAATAAVLAIALVLASAARAAGPPTPAPRAAPAPAPQAAASVRIALTPAGVVVTPERVTVAQGEPVEWVAELPFAVAVQRSDRLFGRALPPQALQGMANRPVQAQVAPEAPAGAYKYSVAVWDGERVWVVDPEIVVSPRRP